MMLIMRELLTRLLSDTNLDNVESHKCPFVLRSDLSSLAVSPKVLLDGLPSSAVELRLLIWQVNKGCCNQLTVEFIRHLVSRLQNGDYPVDEGFLTLCVASK